MNNTTARKNRSEPISFVVWLRAISAILILMCHLVQTHTNPYVVMTSQIFNVGVNVFIIISGFLFGRLGIGRPYGKWLTRRLKRIYYPYWLFLAIITVAHLLRGYEINIPTVLFSVTGAQGFHYVFPGFEHTWFISAILLCYLFTPLIDILTNRVIHKKSKKCGMVLIVLLALAPIGIAFLPNYAIFDPLPFYALAFILGRRWERIQITKKQAMLALACAAFAFGLRFIARIWLDETIWYNRMIAVYTHYLAGFCMFFASAWFLNRNPIKLFGFISEISFEVYLYHYMFIWPPLSVMSISENWLINCIAALVASMMSSWVMNVALKTIRQKLSAATMAY